MQLSTKREEAKYMFVDAGMREVCQSLMVESQRRQIRLKVAAANESKQVLGSLMDSMSSSALSETCVHEAECNNLRRSLSPSMLGTSQRGVQRPICDGRDDTTRPGNDETSFSSTNSDTDINWWLAKSPKDPKARASGKLSSPSSKSIHPTRTATDPGWLSKASPLRSGRSFSRHSEATHSSRRGRSLSQLTSSLTMSSGARLSWITSSPALSTSPHSSKTKSNSPQATRRTLNRFSSGSVKPVGTAHGQARIEQQPRVSRRQLSFMRPFKATFLRQLVHRSNAPVSPAVTWPQKQTKRKSWLRKKPTRKEGIEGGHGKSSVSNGEDTESQTPPNLHVPMTPPSPIDLQLPAAETERPAPRFFEMHLNDNGPGALQPNDQSLDARLANMGKLADADNGRLTVLVGSKRATRPAAARRLFD